MGLNYPLVSVRFSLRKLLRLCFHCLLCSDSCPVLFHSKQLKIPFLIVGCEFELNCSQAFFLLAPISISSVFADGESDASSSGIRLPHHQECNPSVLLNVIHF